MKKNTMPNIWDRFIELELKYKIYNQIIGNCKYWDYLRFHVYHEILGVKNTPPKTFKNKHIGRIARLLKRLINTIKYNPFFSGEYEYLFVNAANSRRKLDADGRYVDIWCDPIIKHLGVEKCLLLENFDLPLGSCNLPISTRHVISLDASMLYFSLLGKRTRPLLLSEKDKKILLDIERDIDTNFKKKINLIDMLSIITYQNLLECFLGKLLKRIKPKAVFIICSYGKEGYISACKKAGIPVIELQHGVLGKSSISYSYPNNAEKELFPDYFFSFGQFWLDTTFLPIDQKKCFAIGYPYLSDNKAFYKNRLKKKQILFLSQWTNGKELSEFAARVRVLLPVDWEIIYKLHPAEQAQWQEIYPWLNVTGINVIVGDDAPLYQLLSESRIQVGVYTAALFEGLVFGCKTYLVDLHGIEYMEELINKRFATVISNPEQLVIAADVDGKYDCSEFFAENWKLNFDLALEQCLKASG